MSLKSKIFFGIGIVAALNGVFYGTACSCSTLPPDAVNGFVIKHVKTDAGNPTQNWTQGADKQHLNLTIWAAFAGQGLSLFQIWYYSSQETYAIVPQNSISCTVEDSNVVTFHNPVDEHSSGFYCAGTLGETLAFVHAAYENKNIDYVFDIKNIAPPL